MSLFSVAGMLAALSLATTPALASDVKAGDLTIQHPWARATPSGAQVAGGYLAVVNKGQGADRLIGGSLAAAQAFELHQMAMTGTVMTMRATGPLTIPAGGTLRLEPSGTHIMFTGLKRGLKKGDTIDGTLVFEHAGTVPVQFAIEGIGARGPSQDDRSGRARSMPGMDMN